MVKRKRAALLPTNIALLQNLIRRDPLSYRDEFLLQFRHYESLRDIFLLDPYSSAEQCEEFVELIGFVAHMCSCFPKETNEFPQTIMDMLSQRHDQLPHELREKLVQNIVMLRNKGIITSEALVQCLFPVLVATDSKALRSQIYTSVITLIKTVNQGTRNQKLNRAVQALLFNLLTDAEANGLWATKITRELWRRGVWDDSRTVEIMTQAATHSNLKVAVSAAKFFLGADKEREDAAAEEEEEEDDSVDVTALKHKYSVNKKNSKKSKKLEAALRASNKKKTHHSATYLNFSAIQLLRDPQGFADSIYTTHLLHGKRLGLDEKILFVNLVARMVGVHKLTVLGLYSFFLKYLTPKQKDVTQFLAAAAQSSHDLVPPDVISPVVRRVADEFVSDGVAAEVAAAGINTIREIVSRAPLSIDQTLLQDLIEYKGSKSKPVMMAARSLISLFRELDPSMLKARDRGKVAHMALRAGELSNSAIKFGDQRGTTGIDGLDLLMKWKEENQKNEGDNAEDDNEWEVASDSDKDSDDEDETGWVNVESDNDYSVSDSDDENAKKKKKTADKEEESSKPAEVDPAKAHEDFIKLASTTVLTPADFAKIEELKAEAGIAKALGVKMLRNEDSVEASALVGPQKFKEAREERIAKAKENQSNDHGSKRGTKLAQKDHSTTNKQKQRKKNFMMLIHKKDVQGKAKRSLRDKSKALRAHIEKQKRGPKG